MANIFLSNMTYNITSKDLKRIFEKLYLKNNILPICNPKRISLLTMSSKKNLIMSEYQRNFCTQNSSSDQESDEDEKKTLEKKIKSEYKKKKQELEKAMKTAFDNKVELLENKFNKKIKKLDETIDELKLSLSTKNDEIKELTEKNSNLKDTLNETINKLDSTETSLNKEKDLLNFEIKELEIKIAELEKEILFLKTNTKNGVEIKDAETQFDIFIEFPIEDFKERLPKDKLKQYYINRLSELTVSSEFNLELSEYYINKIKTFDPTVDIIPKNLFKEFEKEFNQMNFKNNKFHIESAINLIEDYLYIVKNYETNVHSPLLQCLMETSLNELKSIDTEIESSYLQFEFLQKKINFY